MYRYDFPKIHIFDNDLEDHPTYHFYIYDDKSQLPVFHIIPDHIYSDFTIGLFNAEYYKYNSKFVYILDYPEILDFVLREPYYRDKSKTNWETLKDIWMTMNNSNKYSKIYNTNIQPDYSILSDKTIRRRSICQAIVSKWRA